MKLITFILVFFIFFLTSFNSTFAQDESSKPEYEMTTYYMAFLKKGPKWSPEVTEETPQFRNIFMKDIVCRGAGRGAAFRLSQAAGAILFPGIDPGGLVRLSYRRQQP